MHCFIISRKVCTSIQNSISIHGGSHNIASLIFKLRSKNIVMFIQLQNGYKLGNYLCLKHRCFNINFIYSLCYSNSLVKKLSTHYHMLNITLSNIYISLVKIKQIVINLSK